MDKDKFSMELMILEVMKMGDMEIKIIRIISEVCDIDEEYLSIDSSIQDDVGISSVTIVETMARIEQEFSISIENDLYNPYLYNTIGDLVKMVQGKISHT